MELPKEKWAFIIVRKRREIQGKLGFYKSGVKDQQAWYGLTLPCIDIRFIKFLQWGKPQKEKHNIKTICDKCHTQYMASKEDVENGTSVCPYCFEERFA
jgi:formylmethanofuran dehydrogenase subunit E